MGKTSDDYDEFLPFPRLKKNRENHRRTFGGEKGDASVGRFEIAAIPRKFRTAGCHEDHPPEENTIATILSMSFDDIASSEGAFNVPRTRGGNFNFKPQSSRHVIFAAEPTRSLLLPLHRPLRVSRDSRNISHGNKERRGKRAATFVRVRTCVGLVQVARGTFRRETSPRNDTMRSVPSVTRGPHNGVTRNGVRAGPLSALCPR